MSQHDHEQERLKYYQMIYETLSSKLNTRENSTLVITTLTSSISFTIFSIYIDNIENLESSYRGYFVFLGFCLSFFGIIYREVTIITIDKKEYNKLKCIKQYIEQFLFDKNRPSCCEVKKTSSGTIILRMIMMRMIFYSSLAIWIPDIWPNLLKILTKNPFVMFIFTISLICSISFSLLDISVRNP